MRMYDIIDDKVNGNALTRQEIEYAVKSFTNGDIPDYQMSALLMAICLKGLNDEEIFQLTNAMLRTGKVMDLSGIKGVKVDKHSTGGVGDKTSLVLGPMLVACGAKLAKTSGRGLGHTGGTLDKLESIPGFNVTLTDEQFIDQVNRIGIAIAGQSKDICPADKKMYALRDATCTVNSIGLIASSIMSKKIADGADAQLLDVKYGNGAFMKDIDSARKLAETMVTIGKKSGLKTCAEITNMNVPLGYEIGNSNEVIEAINTLKGNGPRDLLDLCLHSGEILLTITGLYPSKDIAHRHLIDSIASGKAFDVFCRMVDVQGGDVSFVKDTSKFPVAKYNVNVKALTDGYVTSMDTYDLGIQAMKLGAGRAVETDIVDHAAGISLKKKVGDSVKKGETLCVLHSERPRLEENVRAVTADFVIGTKKVLPAPLIEEVIL